MTWARLDDGFHSHPKTLAIGNDGAGLYARALSYCGDHLTDGFVPIAWAKSAASPRLRQRLVEHGAWAEVEGGYVIPDFLDFNPSKADVEAVRERKSAAGKEGAKRRWGHSGSHSTSHGTSQPSANGSRHAPDPTLDPARTQTQPLPQIQKTEPVFEVAASKDLRWDEDFGETLDEYRARLQAKIDAAKVDAA